MRVAAGLRQILQPEVELVIAHHHRVVPDRVHRQHHWIVFESRSALLLVHRLERSALDGVAAIDQQVVRILGSRSLDQRRDFRQAALGRLRGVIVVGKQIAVQIGGGEQRDLQFRAAGERCQNRSRQERAQSAHYGNNFQYNRAT